VDLPEAEARRRFAAARVARMATSDQSYQPHLVPVTFAVRGDVVVIAIDHKPKRSTDLKRLRNIAGTGLVSLLVDEYSEDWSRLWWVRADGRAEVLQEAREEPLDWLAAKYEQYRRARPAGPVIRIQVHRWRGWAATEG
jgi:PPOX class probable F420-dependent enzyme